MSKEPTVMRAGSTDRYGEEEVHSPTAKGLLYLCKSEDIDIFTNDGVDGVDGVYECVALCY